MSKADIAACAGYKSLLKSVEGDEKSSPEFHNYRAKLQLVLDRANHYADKTGLAASEILDAWEADRDYWYMNYYQECRQPAIKDGAVKVFDTVHDFLTSIGEHGFRCPSCGGISKSPYECDSGMENEPGHVCDWKVFGLFGHMGKGVYVFVKDKVRGENIFMPIAWEDEPKGDEA